MYVRVLAAAFIDAQWLECSCLFVFIVQGLDHMHVVQPNGSLFLCFRALWGVKRLIARDCSSNVHWEVGRKSQWTGTGRWCIFKCPFSNRRGEQILGTANAYIPTTSASNQLYSLTHLSTVSQPASSIGLYPLSPLSS